MRKVIWCLVLVFTLAFYFCGPAMAVVQNHYGATLICHDCHTVHASEGNALVGGTAGGNDRLLVSSSINASCLVCHDGQAQDTAGSAPDVMTAYSGAAGFVRKGGTFQAASGTASDNAHDLGVAAAVDAPGALDTGSSGFKYTTSATTGLTCCSCHEPHGSVNYENLKTDPNSANGAVIPISVVLNTDITLATNIAGANTPSTKYSLGNVKYLNGKLSNFCADCHYDFHHRQGSDNLIGDANGANDAWERHPTGRSIADAETTIASVTSITMGNTNGHASFAYWSNGSRVSRVPVADPAGTVCDGDEYPICVTCHQAHGTAHPAATLWDDDSTAALADGANINQTCKQCHNKGY